MAKQKISPKNEVVSSNGENKNSEMTLEVKKTYKLYIGGKFPRTESGRFFQINNAKGQLMANMCHGSRKDFRNSVVASRSAFKPWASRSAYNKSQILYRIGEVLESRKEQFIQRIMEFGKSKEAAQKEVRDTIDRWVHYAGWADKYQQIFSSVNPVASSHFNFSMLEPMGVISVFSPESNVLLGLASSLAPVICGGNTAVALVSGVECPIAIDFAEVLNSSDLPGGVINIITGHREELLEHFSTHMDVNGMSYWGKNPDQIKAIKKNAVHNVKRVRVYSEDIQSEKAQSPYFISDTTETKTTWHPVGI